MFTRCPECNTHFRVTAENLRAANGEVCCGSCETEFNALASLTDTVPAENVEHDDRLEISVDNPDIDDRDIESADDDESGELEIELESEDMLTETSRLEQETWNSDEWQALLDSTQSASGAVGKNEPEPDESEDEIELEPEYESDDDDSTDEERDGEGEDEEDESFGEIIVLESPPPDDGQDLPNEDDSEIETDDEAMLEDHERHDQYPEQSEPVFSSESLNIDSDSGNIDGAAASGDSEEFHRWLSGDIAAEEGFAREPGSTSRGWLVVTFILALTLFGQTLHYNRDNFAADSRYGGIVRQLYDSVGLTLYPEWALDSFEVRGTEAVAEDAASSALNILANVLVVGEQPVGMPVIRVVLHDRWSDPVASGIFQPDQYLDTKEPRPSLLAPGTTLPIKVSVADPGAEARGYVVDICLPRRSFGLQCQLATDPFRK